MPLHLLSKKSWNVYAPENIARVKRDQAEAKAREEEDDRRQQEDDAATRLATLRREFPAELPSTGAELPKKQASRDDNIRKDDRRKRRRLHGEDDTERDLRLAREDMESRHKYSDRYDKSGEKRSRSDAPIVGHDGHINLFPVDHRVNAREHKNVEVEAEKARKQRELEDQYTMRFSNAAGRDGFKQGPWYASKKRPQREDMDFVEGKDVWGKPDPSAKDREQARQNSNDPFAFMQKAQSQLKLAERDRRRWKEEEQGNSTKSEEHRQHRHHKRRADDHNSARGTEGDTKNRGRNKDYEHRRGRLKENSRHHRRSHEGESLSEVPDEFSLSV